MNKLVFALALTILCSATASSEEERTLVTLDTTTAQAAICRAKKCMLVTSEQVFEAIDRAHKAGRAQALEEVEEDMDSNGCKRGKT